jgi:hypothetical protein
MYDDAPSRRWRRPPRIHLPRVAVLPGPHGAAAERMSRLRWDKTAEVDIIETLIALLPA